ncbi:alpha/beta fold hydrolase [Luteibacter aegosomatissinici]|uniref:alpha/beta fold hydrolase n=1 Tax=Luteibacter aegosomatissinici TaxID=2911539 RepID=UPI001FFB8535|nr:alpha/beta hydrolase [Luteibacter aegosomatissinici]UPG94610.1 alpha/beta hydrolase [Luteibacter aegosomatissinici]
MNAQNAADYPVHHRYVDADGVRVFYREAGNPNAPTLLLLHGFPTSSLQYRELFAELKDRFHIVAPDLPGFGFTEVPEARKYEYSFDSLGKTLEAFVDAVGLQSYIMYVFDYGAPSGLRLAVAKPERLVGLISQNGNAYVEGLGDAWDPIRTYWAEPTQANRDAIAGVFTLEGIQWQYTTGVADQTLLDPMMWQMDYMLMQRPGNNEIQLDLTLDYRNNLTLYPEFHRVFRERQVPTLVIWGKNDPFFIPPGAEAYRRDNPNAIVEMLDTGHFALETHGKYIAKRIREVFLG